MISTYPASLEVHKELRVFMKARKSLGTEAVMGTERCAVQNTLKDWNVEGVEAQKMAVSDRRRSGVLCRAGRWPRMPKSKDHKLSFHPNNKRLSWSFGKAESDSLNFSKDIKQRFERKKPAI